jgi:hypothetical protein
MMRALNFNNGAKIMADLFGHYRILYTLSLSLSLHVGTTAQKHYFACIRAVSCAAFHCYRQGEPMLFL